ncbi:MAG: hypothetical protein IKL56_06290 [Bacteroidaceae bacterium]|nr:hypothetical protein [Bacteroidaceae bacterium]
MKRYILTTLFALVLFAGSAFATGHIPQNDGKSEAEMYIKKVAKIKSDEIDYAYISSSMFRQMFKMLGADGELNDIPLPLTSIRSMRQFTATGPEGYKQLSQAMDIFLQEEESVMGMKLMALNREDGTMTAIYGDSGNTLVINDEGDELSVVFIAGLSYDSFKTLGENGMEIGF